MHYDRIRQQLLDSEPAVVLVSFAGSAVLAASADGGINTVVYNANNTTDDFMIVEDSSVVEDLYVLIDAMVGVL